MKGDVLNRRKFLKVLGLGAGVGVAAALVGIRLEDVPILGRKVIVIGHKKALAAGVADYVCNGVQDDVQLQAALDALPSIGGKLIILAGTYNFTATVSRAIDNVIIEGVGFGTLFNNDGATVLFDAGAQDGWVFRDFATDAGGLDYASATNYMLESVMEGSTYRSIFINGIDIVIALSGKIYSLANTFCGGLGVAGTDNTAETVKTVVVPANTLTQAADRLRIRIYFKGDSGAPITMTNKINNVTIATATDGGASDWFMTETWLHYIDNTHANIAEMGATPATGALSAENVAGFVWSADQDVDVIQNQIASNHIIVFCIFLDVFPKGTV